jgi:hypothetical protein
MTRNERVEVFLVDTETDHPIITLELVLPDGVALIMAEVVQDGHAGLARGLHVSVQSGSLRPNAVGFTRIRRLVLQLMEMLGYDILVVEGGIRAGGAGPNHRPRPLRFARKLSSDG